MAEVLGPVEHLREGCDRFDLHRGTCATAVERVIVGVDRHGQSVGSASDGMWRLQHLAGVERVSVGIVVLEAFGNLMEDCGG